jgi:hypothetical protein
VPVFVLKEHQWLPQKKERTSMENNVYIPRIEKKIMNPADIWTTLRLPTCVKASKPAFSLQI